MMVMKVTRYVPRSQNEKVRIQLLDAKNNLTNNKNNTRRRHDKRRQDQGRNPTRKSFPPRARKRSESGRVREGQNSRIRRPSESGHFLIEVLFKIGRFWARAGPGPVWGVFGGSKTGCPKGRPETPPRRSTTRSKSTRSSRLCSVSLSSVLSRSVLLRDVVVGKISFLRPEVGLVLFSVSRGRIRKFYFDLWTFSLDPVTSSVVAVVER